MAYGTMSIGGIGLKTNDDFVFEEDGTMKINKLTYWPVGSIYQSIDSTSPAELFGGTWESIASNRVLIGNSDTKPAGSEGGEESVKLTSKNIPRLLVPVAINTAGSGIHMGQWGWVYQATQVQSSSGYNSYGDWRPVGESNNEAINNIQPYLSVYIWKRIE